jgi:hypothetical protein
MKKTLLLAAALACSGAVAQEKQVWACQFLDSTALKWADGNYETGRMFGYNLLLTVDGDKSEAKSSDSSSVTPMNCKNVDTPETVSCLSKIATASHYYLHKPSGRLGVSDLFGMIIGDSDRNRSPLSVRLYQCTKF